MCSPAAELVLVVVLLLPGVQIEQIQITVIKIMMIPVSCSNDSTKKVTKMAAYNTASSKLYNKA